MTIVLRLVRRRRIRYVFEPSDEQHRTTLVPALGS